ncbi:MAG: AMP-binding protein, partial [Pseudomonadota bacterium]
MAAPRVIEEAAAKPTMWEAFAHVAATRPDAPFLCIPAREGRDYAPGGLELTYGEAHAAADALAEILREKGYGPGHRVALALENRPEHVLTQLALYAVGACQVPVNPDYTDDELSYLLEHSEADLALGLPSNVERLAASGAAPALLQTDLADAPPAPARSGETGRGAAAAIIYTSGTTGRPKGCVIDHEYHFAVGRTYAETGGRLTLRIGEERLFVPLPVFHVNAGINTLSAVILTGNCLISPDRFHANTLWDDVTATRATAMHYLGVIPPILLKRPPGPRDRAHSLRFG